MKINLNDIVKFKLTELGKMIYYHQYDEINERVGKELFKPSFPKEDEDGYTTMQLWMFMELYGRYMAVTAPNVIEPLDLIREDEPDWILCSKELPPDDRTVLVTLKWSEDDYEVSLGEYWHDSPSSKGWGTYEGHVIAWMPLPKPYEGKEDG